MNLLKRVLLGSFFVILVFEILVIAPSLLNDEVVSDDPKAITSKLKPTENEQEMQGVHLIETRDGQKEWELFAENAVGVQQSWSIFNPKITLFGQNGEVYKVTGERGQVNTTTKDLVIEGNVATKTSNGYHFYSDALFYDSTKRMLSSPSDIRMQGPAIKKEKPLKLIGKGMKADLNDSVIQVSKDVVAEKTLKDGKQLNIQSDVAEFSGRSNKALFSGDVKMKIESVKVTGPYANFLYDSKSGELNAVDVYGGVRVSDLEKWATSRKVSVFFDEDKYEFKGNPKVVQDSDELRGEKITFLEGGKKILVERVKAKIERESLETAN